MKMKRLSRKHLSTAVNGGEAQVYGTSTGAVSLRPKAHCVGQSIRGARNAIGGAAAVSNRPGENRVNSHCEGRIQGRPLEGPGRLPEHWKKNLNASTRSPRNFVQLMPFFSFVHVKFLKLRLGWVLSKRAGPPLTGCCGSTQAISLRL